MVMDSFTSTRCFLFEDSIAYCTRYAIQLKGLFLSQFAYSRLCVSKKLYTTRRVNHRICLTRRLWAQTNCRIRVLAVSSAGFVYSSHFVDNLGMYWWSKRGLKKEGVKKGCTEVSDFLASSFGPLHRFVSFVFCMSHPLPNRLGNRLGLAQTTPET
jgi:hypothetical protein